VTVQRTLDVSQLPMYKISNAAPLWWGQVCLAAIEGTMFAILIAMYYYIRLTMDVWPPPGIHVPDQVLPAVCMILLLLSCIGSYVASEAAKKNERFRMIFGLGLNLLLASIAMLLRGLNWNSWNFKWDTTAYGSITWAMMFLHTVDAVADLVFTLVLIVLLVLGRSGPKQRLGVHVDSVIWYFLVAIWIPMYVTIFWGPALVGIPR
jgi:cytochrome c oxidase subunit III